MSEHAGHRDGPTADVSVRVAWADDAPGIGDLQVRAWRQEYAGLLPAEVLESLDADRFAAAWQTSLTKPQDARNRVLVALERNTVARLRGHRPDLRPRRRPGRGRRDPRADVDPDQTRHGHGSRLVQACADTLAADRFTHRTWSG